AMSASRINSFDANFPVPTRRRDANSRSAIFSFEGLSAMGKNSRIHGYARMSSAGKATNLYLYKHAITQDLLAMTKFELRGQDSITGMSQLAAKSVDLVMTSPPYNLGISYGKYSDRQDRRSYLGWCGEWAGQIRRVLKPDGSFFLNIGAAPSNPMLPHEIVTTLGGFLVLQKTIHWIKSITIDDHCSRRPAGDVRA